MCLYRFYFWSDATYSLCLDGCMEKMSDMVFKINRRLINPPCLRPIMTVWRFNMHKESGSLKVKDWLRKCQCIEAKPPVKARFHI